MEGFSIGARIRAARALAGMGGVPELEKRLKERGLVRGLGKTNLYLLEQDKVERIDTRNLEAIADACGVPLAWFVADFSRLAEIAPEDDPRKTLAQQTAEAVRRAEERRANKTAKQPPLREAGQ